MRERGARDRFSLAFRARRKRACQVALRNPAARAVEDIDRPAQQRPGRAGQAVRHQAHRHEQGLDQRVFQSVSHRIRPRSQSRNSSAGSIPTRSGTAATRNSPKSHASRRTPSFSVVSTMAAAAARAAAAMRLMSAREKRWWSRKPIEPDEVPPRGRDIGKKALGPGNRGHRKHAGLRRHHDRVERIRNRTRRPQRAGHLERRSESRPSAPHDPRRSHNRPTPAPHRRRPRL